MMVSLKSAEKAEKLLLAAIFLYAFSLPISMAATNFALALAVLSALLLAANKKIRPVVPVSILVLLAFFFWAGLTDIMKSGFSLKYFSSFAKTWNFLPYVILPAGLAAVNPKFNAVMKTGAGAGCFVVILGVLQYVFGIHYFFEGWFGSGALIELNRFVGYQNHPLHTAALYTILFLTAFAMSLFADAGNPGRSGFGETVFWNLASVILGIGVLITASRSYYVAMAFGVFFLLALRGWKFLAAGIAGAIIFLFILGMTNTYVKERFRTIDPRNTDSSGIQRIYMWKCALLMIKDHPVAGVGYRKWKDNLPVYSGMVPGWTNVDSAAVGHAHNTYLTIAAETGLTGLSIMLLFWVALLKEQIALLNSIGRAGISYALAAGSIASIISIMAAGCFEHNLLTATVCLALFFTIGLSRGSGMFDGKPVA